MSTYTLADVQAACESWWPPATAELWDAVGLVTGNPSAHVSRVVLVVDVVRDTVDDAISRGVDVMIAHHPLLLRGVTSVAEDRYKGRLVADLIRSGIALFSAHTNADAAPGGTSDRLATALGLTETEPLTVSDSTPDDVVRGIGRVGTLARPMRLYDLASTLGALLPQTARGLAVSGDPDHSVSSVAVCTGAGDSLLSHPRVRTADVYITADLRHHPASETAEERIAGGAPALIDMSHFASEWFFLDGVKTDIEKALPGLEVQVSDVVTDPWTFVVHPA